MHNPRRNLVKGLAIGGGAFAAGLHAPFVRAQAADFRIGHLSPRTGPLASNKEVDAFVVKQIQQTLPKGVESKTGTRRLQIFDLDSSSSPDKAREVVTELIEKEKVDVVLVSGGWQIVTPVSELCESHGVPCVSTGDTWQLHMATRNRTGKTGFKWTNHMSHGSDDVVRTMASMWNKVKSNHVVGGLWADDPDSDVFLSKTTGFESVADTRPFTFVHQRVGETQVEFAQVIAELVRANAEILTGALNPVALKAFWAQARQMGFRPKFVCLARGGARSDMTMLGSSADNFCALPDWMATHPFRGSLTGNSGTELAVQFINTVGRDWPVALGTRYAQFEVAVAALRDATEATRVAYQKAIRNPEGLKTIAGPLNFEKGPVPGISLLPLVGAQWQRNGQYVNLAVVENLRAPMIPARAKIALI